jgi:hypothetical protein
MRAMKDVTIAHAKEHLEELVARAAQGEEVHIIDPKLGGQADADRRRGEAVDEAHARTLEGSHSRAAAWLLRAHDRGGA